MPKCAKCKKVKFPFDFPDDKRKVSGKSSWCKVCHHEGVRRSRKRYPEAAALVQKAYRERKRRAE